MKKLSVIAIILTVFMLFEFSVPSFAAVDIIGNNSGLENTTDNFEIYDKVIAANRIEKKLIYDNGDEFTFYFENNKLYDSNRKLIAVYEREPIVNIVSIRNSGIVTPMGTDFSTTSPYPISDYSNYVGFTTGNIHIQEGVLAVSIGVLSVILSFVAPPAAAAMMSVFLIAEGVKWGINEHAIFYNKYVYNHKYLGSLATMYKTQFYWNPEKTSRAGDYQYYYATFM